MPARRAYSIRKMDPYSLSRCAIFNMSYHHFFPIVLLFMIPVIVCPNLNDIGSFDAVMPEPDDIRRLLK